MSLHCDDSLPAAKTPGGAPALASPATAVASRDVAGDRRRVRDLVELRTTRRGFLAGGAAAVSAARLPASAPAAGVGDRAVVAIQVEGGWDYLSALVPAGHWAYQEARPNLRIPRSAVLDVEAGWDWYWHPSLWPFRDLYNRGDLAIVENVGYPTPDLSHFESIKKWHAGDPTVGAFHSGWMGRYLSTAYTGLSPLPALDIEPYPSPVFAGYRVPAVLDAGTLNLNFDWNSPEDSAVGRLALEAGTAYSEMVETGLVGEVAARAAHAHRFANALRELGRSYAPRASYPNTGLAQELQLAARYLSAGVPIQVFHLKTSGFDTHSLQAQRNDPAQGLFASLIGDLSAAVKAFLDDMSAWGRANDVVVLLYSEFGRRVSENGALGTDHGHGSVMFLAGAPVVGGRYGQTPDLAALHRPNESYYIPFDARSTDFRRVYATILERWFQVASDPILGGSFAPLNAL
ncbi:MAG: DUF1501 domain-containing protein [Planctomycetota bacterium]